MAIVQGITYNSTDNIITVQFVDGAIKGDSFNDPYTFQDIYDTDQDNGWGVFHQPYSDAYTPDVEINVQGSDTYIKIENISITWMGSINNTVLFKIDIGANVKLINSTLKNKN